ncbi:hypothetical protein EV562_111221 [Streptomyces sp. BK208]|nr:hypothetical protein EV562_111221 [Streptomyces sp. BK208]
MTTTSQTSAAQPREPALSVRQVLGPERVRAGQPEAVAGAHRLDRPVRRVHVAEAVDVGVTLSGQGAENVLNPSATSRGRRPNSSSGTSARASSARSATAGSSATALRAPTPR